MILEEGGGGIEDTVLFGKYRLCRVLGTGRAGTVYLAVHIKLEEYRAIKRVPKSFVDYERFRREALILKELRHPGIPIVYDLEEDQEFSYLIEEYLEGVSLHTLIQEEGYLPRRLVIHYGISICRIVMYLHSAGTIPILHLDLQPKNLLLCQDTVKLIDFDHAACLRDANLSDKRYGTPGCAAPEQYTGGELDTRTDIYAIGVLLYYMGTGTYPVFPVKRKTGWGKALFDMINGCLNPDRSLRPQSAALVCEALERLQETGTGVFTHEKSSLTIAFAGSKSGVGTTHLSIGLSVYLKNHGYPNLYEEKNTSKAAERMGTYFRAPRDRYGCMRRCGFVWKPYYGECVKLAESAYHVRVRDYGADCARAAAEEPDCVVLVCGGKWWDAASGEEALKSLRGSGTPPVFLVYNQTVPAVRVKPTAKIPENRCFKAPVFPDPFRSSRAAEDFYQFLLERMEAEMGGIRKRRLRGIRISRLLERIIGRQE